MGWIRDALATAMPPGVWGVLLLAQEGSGKLAATEHPAAIAAVLAVFGAMLAGFLRYMSKRDLRDKEVHAGCEVTIQKVADSSKDAVHALIAVFKTEQSTERDKRDKDNEKWRDTVHQVRSNVNEAYARGVQDALAKLVEKPKAP